MSRSLKRLFTIHEDDVFNAQQLRVQVGGPKITVKKGPTIDDMVGGAEGRLRDAGRSITYRFGAVQAVRFRP